VGSHSPYLTDHPSGSWCIDAKEGEGCKAQRIDQLLPISCEVSYTGASRAGNNACRGTQSNKQRGLMNVEEHDDGRSRVAKFVVVHSTRVMLSGCSNAIRRVWPVCFISGSNDSPV
jgi:hypothetical protein